MARGGAVEVVTPLSGSVDLGRGDHAFVLVGWWHASSTKQRLVQEHQATLDAIAAGEAGPAGELMTEHIRGFYNEHVLKANPIERPAYQYPI